MLGGMARSRSEEEIQQVLEQYRGSGLSQMEYCQRTATVLSALARYLRRRMSGVQKLIRVKVESAPRNSVVFVSEDHNSLASIPPSSDFRMPFQR